MNILIIGSQGFIGSNAVDYFIKKKYEVYHCDIGQADKRNNYFAVSAHDSDFNILFQDKKFDYCINASGAADVQFSFKNPAIDFALNVINVEKILEAIRTCNPTCKFINFSSAAVYGNPIELPILEISKSAPLSPYGWHKLQSEILCREYFTCFNINTISLRVFSAFGEGLKKQLFWDLYQKSKSSVVVELFGTGEEGRDFIYIQDLLLALDCVMTNSLFDGEVINVANGEAIRIKDAAQIFFENLDKKIELKFTSKIKTGDPVYWQADIEKLKRLEFVPRYSFKEGLTNTFKWLELNG
jgi:dTDP-glucose 4,6-dehydratase/UDP-glucose 4-epimerase